MGNRGNHIFIDEQGDTLPVNFSSHWDLESIVYDICKIAQKRQYSFELQTEMIRDIDGLELYASDGVEVIYDFKKGTVKFAWEAEPGITSVFYNHCASGLPFAEYVAGFDSNGWGHYDIPIMD
jgi:hypothetical protein